MVLARFTRVPARDHYEWIDQIPRLRGERRAVPLLSSTTAGQGSDKSVEKGYEEMWVTIGVNHGRTRRTKPQCRPNSGTRMSRSCTVRHAEAQWRLARGALAAARIRWTGAADRKRFAQGASAAVPAQWTGGNSCRTRQRRSRSAHQRTGDDWAGRYGSASWSMQNLRYTHGMLQRVVIAASP